MSSYLSANLSFHGIQLHEQALYVHYLEHHLELSDNTSTYVAEQNNSLHLKQSDHSYQVVSENSQHNHELNCSTHHQSILRPHRPTNAVVSRTWDKKDCTLWCGWVSNYTCTHAGTNAFQFAFCSFVNVLSICRRVLLNISATGFPFGW